MSLSSLQVSLQFRHKVFVCLVTTKILADILTVLGRYNKFCRSLPQTPWVIDGQRRMESSVEELIAAPILATFRADGESWKLLRLHFSQLDLSPTLLFQVLTSPPPAGRMWTSGPLEMVRLVSKAWLCLRLKFDFPVLLWSAGRPFAMELLNPHRSRVSKVEMKQLQEVQESTLWTSLSSTFSYIVYYCFQTINGSSDKIRVRDLQIVTRWECGCVNGWPARDTEPDQMGFVWSTCREATSRMKEGEEEKTKSYTALVWTHKAIQREDLSFMDDIKVQTTHTHPTPLPANVIFQLL